MQLVMLISKASLAINSPKTGTSSNNMLNNMLRLSCKELSIRYPYHEIIF